MSWPGFARLFTSSLFDPRSFFAAKANASTAAPLAALKAPVLTVSTDVFRQRIEKDKQAKWHVNEAQEHEWHEKEQAKSESYYSCFKKYRDVIEEYVFFTPLREPVDSIRMK